MPFIIENILDKLNRNAVCCDSVNRDAAISADFAGKAAFAYSSGHHDQITANACHMANTHDLWTALEYAAKCEHDFAGVLHVLDRLIPLNAQAIDAMAYVYFDHFGDHVFYGHSLKSITTGLRLRLNVYATTPTPDVKAPAPLKPKADAHVRKRDIEAAKARVDAEVNAILGRSSVTAIARHCTPEEF